MTTSLLLRRPALEAVELATQYRFKDRVLTIGQIMALLRGSVLNTNNPLWYDAAVNAVTALLNSGFIKIYSGAQPALDVAVTGTLLATMTFGVTAFGASSSGTATANSITSGTAAATNTAGYFALVKSDTTTVVGTGTCGTSGSDLNLNSTGITSGATVSCSSFTIVG